MKMYPCTEYLSWQLAKNALKIFLFSDTFNFGSPSNSENYYVQLCTTNYTFFCVV